MLSVAISYLSYFGLKISRQLCTILKMKIKDMILFFIPVLLFACTALKPVEKLTDKELIDRYYKTDLNLYMMKRAAAKSNPTSYAGEAGNTGSSYSSRDIEKIIKIESKLAIMKQEMNKRGYMP